MYQFMMKSEDNVIRQVPLRHITDDLRAIAKKQFLEAKQQGVLLSAFQDMSWVATDQQSKYTIRFGTKSPEVETICIEREIPYMQFIEDLKAIIVFRLGTCGLNDLISLVNYSITEFIESHGFLKAIKHRSLNHGRVLSLHLEFAKLMSFSSKEYIDSCKKELLVIHERNRISKDDRHPCSLNEFQSYFKFDDALTDFWEMASDEQKCIYYPLYLFWNISTILPLRVTEFCLTPFECIKEQAGRYYLTIRRSVLKGSSALNPRIHKYKINEDYNKYTYEISKRIFDMIDDYIHITKDCNHEFGLLFSLDFIATHSRGKIVPSTDRVFSAIDLTALLRMFYKEVLLGTFGYTLVTEEDLLQRYKDDDGSYEMASEEIMMMKCKETRHLSMINLVLRGCNPMMIWEFAGHADESMSSHYYANVSKTVRCATKRLYHLYKNRKNADGYISKTAKWNPGSLLVKHTDNFIEMDHGKCYSEHFAKDDYCDCKEVNWQCKNCVYSEISDSIPYDTAELDYEMDYLVKMLRDPKTEDRITEFQLRAQQLETHMQNYASLIWKEYMENENGTKKEV